MRQRIFGALMAAALVIAPLSIISVMSLASVCAGGQADLRGYWTNATFTPLERPADLAGKEFLTEAEAAAYEKKRLLLEESQAKDDIHYDNAIWQKESYDKVVSRRRTSLVIDPPDGKLPPLTPAA